MAIIQPSALSRRGLALVLMLASLSVGCVGTTWQSLRGAGESVGPCQVGAAWQNTVVFTPDTVNNGKMAPGLAGRVYLFGPEISYPMLGDGGIWVELYDETGDRSALQECWAFYPSDLKRLSRRDMIGEGYTIFLPWANYKPAVTKVRLKVRYQPQKGAPLFTENVLTLSPTNGAIRVQHSPQIVQTGNKEARPK